MLESIWWIFCFVVAFASAKRIDLNENYRIIDCEQGHRSWRTVNEDSPWITNGANGTGLYKITEVEHGRNTAVTFHTTQDTTHCPNCGINVNFSGWLKAHHPNSWFPRKAGHFVLLYRVIEPVEENKCYHIMYSNGGRKLSINDGDGYVGGFSEKATTFKFVRS